MTQVRLLWALRQTELPGSLTARKLWRVAMCGLGCGMKGPSSLALPASDLCRVMVAAARLGFRPPLQDLAQVRHITHLSNRHWIDTLSRDRAAISLERAGNDAPPLIFASLLLLVTKALRPQLHSDPPCVRRR